MPSPCTTKYFAPLILYASLISWLMLSRRRSCGMLVQRVEKSKLSKRLAPLVLFTFFSFFRTSAALSIIQKQLMPVFLVIPSQYCLKCVVISLRLDVSNCDSGLVVHALEAAINLLPIGFLYIFGSQYKPGSCFISVGILMFCLVKKSCMIV